MPGRRKAAPKVVQAHSTGLSVIGTSGCGKTTSVKRILSRYPQVIVHGAEADDMPVTTQLVWLMITCPGDGGVVGLARAIIRAFDVVLGTNLSDGFIRSRASAETMRAAAVSLAHLHALGVLVIDEIQILQRSKGDNAESIMNFLLTMMNDLRVPVVVIGTGGAKDFLSKELQSGRRFSSGGHFPMGPLARGPELDGFVRRLWSRRLVRETPDWDALEEGQRKAILRTIWLMTAGIHDLVVKSFMLAQCRALEVGGETLTPEVFKTVYEVDFAMLHDVIRRMRKGGQVDDAEWDAMRNAFMPGSFAKVEPAFPVAPRAAAPVGGTDADERRDKPAHPGEAPAKRKRVRKPSPPHRDRKADPDRGAASVAELRACGMLGRPLTGERGDVVG
nr:AAA family ATPase [Pararoseomonas baculiformis]